MESQEIASTAAPLRIDVDALLRKRVPKYYRFMPGCLIRGVERLICQKELNDLLMANSDKRGAQFARGVLDHLDVKVDFHNQECLPRDNSRIIIVSNHPLGGLDGMALIDFVERYYGKAPRFVVNDLLMAIEPLRDVFIPVNKHGSLSRESFKALDEALKSDAPVIVFPAGLVSRRHKGGTIADLRWRKMFVNKARDTGRPIVPAFFSGRNSSFFYNFAKFRSKIGMKFNIEMVLLPKEVFRNRGAAFEVYFAPACDVADFPPGLSAQAIADDIRARVYSLAPGKCHSKQP